MKAAVGKPRSLRNGARVLSRSHCRRAGRLQVRGCRERGGFGKWIPLVPDDGSSALRAKENIRNQLNKQVFWARLQRFSSFGMSAATRFIQAYNNLTTFCPLAE